MSSLDAMHQPGPELELENDQESVPQNTVEIASNDEEDGGRMRLASDSHIEIDLSTLRDDTADNTEEDIREAEAVNVRPPEQVKPSFTFKRGAVQQQQQQQLQRGQ